jgi:cell division protein FtsB
MTVKKQSAAPKKAVARKESIFLRQRVGTVFIAILALLLGYTVIFGQNGVLAYARKRHQSEELARQIQQLQQENARLKVETDRLQQDPSAIEHQAREQLHYTRPGEVIYTLPAAPAHPATQTQKK